VVQVCSEIGRQPVAGLRPACRNARTHTRKQIRQIADSIERFGFVTPILVDGADRIVAGHGRWKAAQLLGLADVPTMSLEHLGVEERRAYAIADNQLAALAGWDRELLALEIAEIEVAMPELDLTVTGFEIEQIAILRDVAGSKRSKKQADAAAPPSGTAVTCSGDLWALGDHLLLCGDALDGDTYKRLLGSDRADLIVTDPPYNVPIAGHVTGQRTHREFEMASGEMSREQFQRFLSATCRHLARHSRSGSLHYIFMDWRSIADLVAAGEEHYSELLNVIVWVKPQGGMGSLYRSRHELVALFRNGRRSHTNNVELGVHGRNRTNVWEYPGVSGFGPDRALGGLHPTVKNLDMIADAIRDASHKGNLVLDPFGGSGTTLIAACRTDRRARIIELDPVYCDLCIRRALAEGLPVSLVGSGDTFADVADARSVAPHAGGGEPTA
jgi:DNA modification methylase